MKTGRTENHVLGAIKEWAEAEENVRAVLLTSSRARPDFTPDFLSDYDIVLYVADLSPFLNNDSWLGRFGEVMVRWPYKPQATLEEFGLTRLVLFTDYVRIDFQITDRPSVGPDQYDDGYKVLVDKEGITKELSRPTYTKYIIRKPTREEYEELINDFWWDAAYVPKYLWRDQLPFAKYMFAQAVHDTYLRKIIEWYIGLRNSWSVDTGLGGRYFKRFLEPEMWRRFESTYAGTDIEENWEAFFNAVSLFCESARTVGDALGYPYPEEMEQRMVAYFRMIRETVR